MKHILTLSVLTMFAFLASRPCDAQITGNVTLVGDAPKPVEIDMSGMPDCKAMHVDPLYEPTLIVGEKNELANVVITVKPLPKAAPLPTGDVPKTPAILNQKGCEYQPHILIVRVGQPIEVKNEDAFMHNVHSLAAANADFNIVQAGVDPGAKIEAPTAVETFRVKCDVHPWMSAYIVATDTPYVAVTDEHGHFEISAKLPDGDYILDAWQEKFGSQPTKITVEHGKAAVDIAFKPESSRANDSPTKMQTAINLSRCCR